MTKSPSQPSSVHPRPLDSDSPHALCPKLLEQHRTQVQRCRRTPRTSIAHVPFHRNILAFQSALDLLVVHPTPRAFAWSEHSIHANALPTCAAVHTIRVSRLGLEGFVKYCPRNGNYRIIFRSYLTAGTKAGSIVRCLTDLRGSSTGERDEFSGMCQSTKLYFATLSF